MHRSATGVRCVLGTISQRMYDMRHSAGVILGICVIWCPIPIVLGQAPGPSQPDLTRLTRRMAEEVRRLGDDIGQDLGQSPAGSYLIQDTRELEQAVGEFAATVQA